MGCGASKTTAATDQELEPTNTQSSSKSPKSPSLSLPPIESKEDEREKRKGSRLRDSGSSHRSLEVSTSNPRSHPLTHQSGSAPISSSIISSSPISSGGSFLSTSSPTPGSSPSPSLASPLSTSSTPPSLNSSPIAAVFHLKNYSPHHSPHHSPLHSPRSPRHPKSPRKPTIATSLMAFVPSVVASQYETTKKGLNSPIAESFEAAILYANVSGFSAIAEKLSLHKDLDGGSERLIDFANGYLGEIIDTIVDHGGDIIEFVGDSLMAIWRVKGMSTLRDVTTRALQCGLYVQDTVGACRINSGAQLLELKLKIQVGAGSVVGIHVGVSNGSEARWAFLLSGREVDRTMVVDHFNSPGNVLVTRSAWGLVKQFCSGKKVGSGYAYQIDDMQTSVSIESLQKVPSSRGLDDLISQYIPPAVVEKLKEQQGKSLSEVRTVTMMSLKFATTTVQPTDPQYLSQIQENFSEVLGVITKFDGMLTHFSYDDKGTYAVAVFGLPTVHVDDPIRAVRAGIQLVKSFHRRELPLCIGISTGVAAAGTVGSSVRSQYTLFGSVVSLAARLMRLAVKNAKISPRPLTPVTPTSPVAAVNFPIKENFPQELLPDFAMGGLSITQPTAKTEFPEQPQETNNKPHPKLNRTTTAASPLPIQVPRKTSLPVMLPSQDPNSAKRAPRVTIPTKEEMMRKKIKGADGEPVELSRSAPASSLCVNGIPLNGALQPTPRSVGDEIVGKTGVSGQGNGSINTVTANTILCDEDTYQLARSQYCFSSLDPVQVKGFKKPIKIFTPEVMLSFQRPSGQEKDPVKSEGFVERESETKVFTQCMKKMIAAEGGSAILVEGEQGQGKTIQINHCVKLAAQKGFLVLLTCTDANEASTPYFAFQEIMQQLAGICDTDSKETWRKKIENKLPVKYHPCLALFNAILPFDFKETEFSSLLKGAARNSYLQNMVLLLIQQEARTRPTLLVVDDVQWLDSSSWNFVIGAIHGVHPLLVLLGTRTCPLPLPLPYAKLLALHTKRLRISPFSDAQISSLVTKTLLLQQAPPPQILDLLKSTVSGNPSHAKELLLELRDSGTITLVKGTVVINTESLTDASLSLNKLITNRVARLDLTLQLILRTGSVIGCFFTVDALRSALPFDEDARSLNDKLQFLEHSGFIEVPEFSDRYSCATGLSPYRFQHASIQQAIYNSLAPKQRHEIHAKVAQWFDGQRPKKGSTVIPAVCHHYQAAEMHVEAIRHLIQAGEHCMEAAAMREALGFFRQVVASPAANTLTQSQIAKIYTLQADAGLATGSFVEANECFRKAFVHYGHPDPLEECKNQTPTTVIEKFLSDISKRKPYATGTPESELYVELSNIAFRYLLSVMWMFPKDFTLNCYAACFTYQMVVRSGWKDYVPGSLAIAVIAMKIHCPAQATSLDPGIVRAVATQKDAALPASVQSLNARCSLGLIQYLTGTGAMVISTAILDKLIVFCEATNEQHVLMLAYVHKGCTMLKEGKFTQVLEELEVANRLCKTTGDSLVYFGLLVPIYEIYCLLMMGRYTEANEARRRVKRIIDDAPHVEIRAFISFAGVEALYFMYRGEYDSAWESVQRAKDLASMRPLLCTYVIAYRACLEVLISLSYQKHLAYNSEVVDLANKMLESFKGFAIMFPIVQPSQLVFERQLRGDSIPKSEAIKLCEKAVAGSQLYGLQYDEGMAFLELAKCYIEGTNTSNPNFATNCKLAVSIFEKIGAMRLYVEITSKYKIKPQSAVPDVPPVMVMRTKSKINFNHSTD